MPRMTTSPSSPEPSVAASSPIESVDRALLVLTALAGAGPRGLVLADLSGRLGIHKTTVHRTLAALRHRDYVAQDATSGAYSLGPAAVALGESYLADDNLVVLLHPALVALSQDVAELVHLGVLVGTDILYLDKVEPDRPVRVWSQVGRSIPAARTALGRALLAFRGTDRDALTRYVEGAELDRVWGELERARELGRAVEDQENEPGIGCVAVPVLRGGVPVVAVSVTAPVERLDPARVAQVHERVRVVLPRYLPAGLHLPD
jgi:IclR family transcriptional regulator, acetate operon repressor